jgi:hypothetical protein
MFTKIMALIDLLHVKIKNVYVLVVTLINE